MGGKSRTIETIIGSDTRIEGNIQVEGSLLIYGVVKGDINSEGVVRIADGARVEGNIKSGDALVGGVVHGDITSSGKVILGEKSELRGNLIAVRLIIEEGAHFEGKCDMQIERRKGGEIEELKFE